MRIRIKPLSVNEAFKGRRFKTDKHNAYVKELTLQLPPINIDFKDQLRVTFTFGFSNRGADIDNPIKPTMDCLQKFYGFNDNKVYSLEVKKEIVKKGDEFIEFRIENI